MALEDILRYESAGVAAFNVKNEKDIAVLAMKNFYNTIAPGLEQSTVLNKAIEEAYAGTQGDAPSITNLGVAQDIGLYSKKYEEALVSAKVSDIAKYLTEGYKVKDEVKEAFEKYNELTFVDLMKKAKESESEEEKKEIEKLAQAVMLLKDRRLKAKSLGIYDGVIAKNLDGMYPTKKEEKKGEEGEE